MDSKELKKTIEPSVSVGLSVFAVFLVIFIGWAGFAELDSAAVAPGKIIPSENQKTIQHLEGGIIAKIHVEEGQQVEQGDPLISLSDTASRSKVQLLNERISGLEAQKKSISQQLELINDEYRDTSSLLEKGLVSKTRVLALERKRAELIGRLGEYTAQIAEAKEQLQASLDVLDRTTITAPFAGLIKGLEYHTIGGVIPPGGVIMEIIPQNDDLVIEARVSPQDIDIVHKGLTAKVMLSAYKRRFMPRLEGTVIRVSADRFTDERSGVPYYTAIVRISEEELASLNKDILLYPGMPADVFIVTGSRTMLNYLFSPIVDSFRRAFKEV